MPKKQIKKQNKNSKKIKKKKIRIRYGRLLVLIIFISLIVFLTKSISNLKITNLYSSNNFFFKDQEIFDIAGISNYPKTFVFTKSKIEKKLKNNVYIKDAKVKKKFLTKVYIEVQENYPIFYYESERKTILLDGSKVDDLFSVPTVINYVPNLKYEELIKKMGLINLDILNRISEIKYDPSDYDDERFLLYMNDGNCVYINLYKFENLNKYVEIIKNFGNKKGIVYLDSGNYFEIVEK